MSGGELERNNRFWERRARANPMHAIYHSKHFADPDAADSELFYEVGRLELETLWAQLAELGVERPAGGRVLDFGCGLGRLTRNLADTFDEVDGVDASPTMIEEARRLHEGRAGIRFHLNEAGDLALFADATFHAVISLITLQHIPPTAALAYLAEMVRVLRPGGLLIVQIPERQAPAQQSGLRLLMRNLRRRLAGTPITTIHAHPEAEVRGVIEGAGAAVLGTLEDGRVGAWGRSLLYVARRS